MSRSRATRLLQLTAVLAVLPASARAARRLSVNDAVAIATARRSELKQADVDVMRARLALLRARLQYTQLTVQASLTEQAQALNVNAPSSLFVGCETTGTCRNESHVYSAGANLTIPLFSGLRVESDIARARALASAAHEQRRSTLRGILVEVVDTYWTVRRADLTYGLLEHALQREIDIEQSTKARVDAGITPVVDYYRAHLLVLRQQSQIKAIAEQRDAALAELGSVLQLDDPVELTDDPPDSAPAVPDLASLEQEALTARPELRAAAATAEAQWFGVRSAKAAYFPQLSVVGSATVGNQVFFPSDLGQPQREERPIGNFFVGGQLNWLIFDMLTTWMNVKDAAHVYERQRQDLVRQRYLVLADVRATYQRLRHEVDRLTLGQLSAKVAQETIESLRKRYRVGSAAIYEVTAAEDQLVSVETDLIATRIAIAQAQAELRAAVGRL